MEARIEASNQENRKIFAQIMLKVDSSQGSGQEGFGSMESPYFKKKRAYGRAY